MTIEFYGPYKILKRFGGTSFFASKNLLKYVKEITDGTLKKLRTFQQENFFD